MKEPRDWPRAMKRSTAAAYCDMSPDSFIREVRAGRMPVPFKLGGSDHWDRLAIDSDLDRLSGAAAYDWRQDQPGLREE